MRVSLVGLLQAAAIVAIVFSVVTAIPIDFYGVQLFAPFKLQYLVISVLLCVALALLRQPVYVGGLLLAVGLNASLVIPWYVAESAPGGDTRLKVLSANILSSNTEHQRLFDLLEAEAPDLVLLQQLPAVDRRRPEVAFEAGCDDPHTLFAAVGHLARDLAADRGDRTPEVA